MNVIAGTQSRICRELKELAPFVQRAVVAFGRPDIYIEVRAESLEQLYELLHEKLNKIENVVSTDTRILVPEEAINRTTPT